MSALQCQNDVARAATTADVAIVQERHLGVRASNGLRVQGEHAMARRVFVRSVERQLLLAGCGRHDLSTGEPVVP